MRLRHLIHSCVLVEMGAQRVLVDPGTFSPEVLELENLDLILITHQHADHVDTERLPRVLAHNPRALVIAEPEAAKSIAQIVADAPGDRVVEPLEAGRTHQLADLRITAHGGRHAIIHPDIPRIGNVGYVLQAPGEPALGITGDSLEPIDAFHGIDVLLFAVVAPWSKMSETIEFLRETRPKVAIPVHDGVASENGRSIYLRQSTDLAPEGTEVRDWPADQVLALDLSQFEH